MSAQNEDDRERERILWCGNLHNDVTEELLYELFLQVLIFKTVCLNFLNTGTVFEIQALNSSEKPTIYLFKVMSLQFIYT